MPHSTRHHYDEDEIYEPPRRPSRAGGILADAGYGLLAIVARAVTWLVIGIVAFVLLLYGCGAIAEKIGDAVPDATTTVP